MDAPQEWYASLVVTILTLLWIASYQWRKKKPHNLPPGPFALPVIGNLHMLGRHPWRSLKIIADKHGPIMFLRLGSIPTVVISSSEAAKLFLKTHDRAFSSRPNVMARRCMFYDNQDVVLCEYGDAWRQNRKICTSQLLTAKRVESMRPAREEEARSMIRKLWIQSKHGSQIVNLSDAFFDFSNESMWHAIARKGFPNKSHELTKLICEISALVLRGSVSDYIPWLGWFEFGKVERKMVKVFSEFDEFANTVLKGHLALRKPSSDTEASFVDALLHISESDSSFNHKRIKALILDMVAGGSETVAVSLEWIASLLLKHPDCLRMLQREINEGVGTNERVKETHLQKMKYLKCVVKEAMRLYPAGPLAVPRESTETVTIDGYVIPRGTRVLVNLWAIGRDPKVWENAEEFMPDRFWDVEDIDFTGWSDFKSLPFSAGRRGCPGAQLASASLMLVVATIFHAFHISLEGDHTEIDMTERASNAMSREKALLAHLKVASNVYFS